MSMPLAKFQEAFASALFAVPGPGDAWLARLVAQPAFAVYRNTVMKACIDALEANFPAVARLVGREWFRAAAALHAVAEAPCDGSLLNYGSGFPAFLRDFEPAAELPYLPGVAALDTLWRESHAAADAQVLDVAALVRCTPEQLAKLTLRPHPATRWAWFDAQPIYSIWSRNRSSAACDESEVVWQAEGALLTRPADAVTWRAVSKAACVFLDACAAGLPLADAADRALDVDADTDLSALLQCLLQAGALQERSP